MSFHAPLGDRMGVNEIEKVTSELIEYLFIHWLSYLQYDVITQRGKVTPRIEFFRDTETKEYKHEELKVENNRFLRVSKLTESIKLPSDMKLMIEKEEGIFPKIILENKHIKIVLTYSTPTVGMSKEYVFTTVRIYFNAFPKRSMWKLDFKNLLSRDSRFYSDRYYRSAKVVLENLQVFFPKQESHSHFE